jgi:hypothetical protein
MIVVSRYSGWTPGFMESDWVAIENAGSDEPRQSKITDEIRVLKFASEFSFVT